MSSEKGLDRQGGIGRGEVADELLVGAHDGKDNPGLPVGFARDADEPVATGVGGAVADRAGLAPDLQFGKQDAVGVFEEFAAGGPSNVPLTSILGLLAILLGKMSRLSGFVREE